MNYSNEALQALIATDAVDLFIADHTISNSNRATDEEKGRYNSVVTFVKTCMTAFNAPANVVFRKISYNLDFPLRAVLNQPTKVKIEKAIASDVEFMNSINNAAYEEDVRKVVKSNKEVRKNVAKRVTNVKKSAKELAKVRNSKAEEIKKGFSIDERFKFLERMTGMVASGTNPALLCTGSAALGKTTTIINELEALGLEEDIDYVVVRGFSTPRYLYQTLFNHRDKLVLFDDTDSVLSNPVAVNILKAVLDSNERRIVTWGSQMSPNSDTPNRFEFEGSVIFISNFRQDQVDQAIKSRCMRVDVTMNQSEKLTRMLTILPKMLPNVPMDIKMEAYEYLKSQADVATELNFRTLIQTIKIRMSSRIAGCEEWKRVALYSIVA